MVTVGVEFYGGPEDGRRQLFINPHREYLIPQARCLSVREFQDLAILGNVVVEKESLVWVLVYRLESWSTGLRYVYQGTRGL